LVNWRLGVALVGLSTVVAAGQPSETGAVTGRVRLTARVRGTPLASNAYQPRSVGRHEAAGTPEIKNVVVYLKGAPFRGTLPTSRHAIEQRNETFVPRVLAVTRGSTVEFPNGDPFFHNVFSLSGAAKFDLGRYPQGQARDRQLTRVGLVKVYCHIHSHMSASILVLDHPYFAAPDLDGTFTLPNIPPGRHTIVGWHERVGEHSATVDVVAGRTASIDLTVPVPAETGEP
jgi:plastocyanin